MNIELFSSLATVCVAMLIGEVVSTRTSGRIPQMLVVSVIFLVGFWTIFPHNILEVSGIQILAKITLGIILIHVGSMFDFRGVIKEWKVVVVILSAITGILVFILGAGWVLYGRDTALVAAAPMTGGAIAALIVSNAANAAGKADLGILANMIFLMHGFFGFPLAAYFLNKESKRLLKSYREDPDHSVLVRAASMPDKNNLESGKRKLYERIPEKYRTTTFYLTVLVLLGCVSLIIGNYTGVNGAVIQVFIGIALKQLGLIEASPLSKAESNGILLLALFASFMASFVSATTEVLAHTALTIFVLMCIATAGLSIFSIIAGRIMGYSASLSFSIGINCFLGFPYNFALTNEAVKATTRTNEEASLLTGYLMPKMIIAGIISISLVSAVLAGIIVGFVF